MIPAQRIADAINQLGDDQEVVLHIDTGQSIVLAIANGQMLYHNILHTEQSSGVSLESAGMNLTSAYVVDECVTLDGECMYIAIPQDAVESMETRPVEFLDEGCGL